MRERLDMIFGPVVVVVVTGKGAFKYEAEAPGIASVEPCQFSWTEEILVPLTVLVLLETFGRRKLSRG